MWIHAPEREVKGHPDYAAAKAGDAEAAFRLVESLASPAVVDELGRHFREQSPVLVSAHAVERDGVKTRSKTWTRA